MNGLSNEDIRYYRALDFHQSLRLLILLPMSFNMSWQVFHLLPTSIDGLVKWQ